MLPKVTFLIVQWFIINQHFAINSSLKKKIYLPFLSLYILTSTPPWPSPSPDEKEGGLDVRIAPLLARYRNDSKGVNFTSQE